MGQILFDQHNGGEKKSPLFPINHRPRATVSWAWSTEPGYQLVVLDTPGIQKPKNKLGRYMEGAVRHSLTDIEAALVVVDGAKGLGSRDEEALFRALRIAACLSSLRSTK